MFETLHNKINHTEKQSGKSSAKIRWSARFLILISTLVFCTSLSEMMPKHRHDYLANIEKKKQENVVLSSHITQINTDIKKYIDEDINKSINHFADTNKTYFVDRESTPYRGRSNTLNSLRRRHLSTISNDQRIVDGLLQYKQLKEKRTVNVEKEKQLRFAHEFNSSNTETLKHETHMSNFTQPNSRKRNVTPFKGLDKRYSENSKVISSDRVIDFHKTAVTKQINKPNKREFVTRQSDLYERKTLSNKPQHSMLKQSYREKTERSFYEKDKIVQNTTTTHFKDLTSKPIQKNKVVAEHKEVLLDQNQSKYKNQLSSQPQYTAITSSQNKAILGDQNKPMETDRVHSQSSTRQSKYSKSNEAVRALQTIRVKEGSHYSVIKSDYLYVGYYSNGYHHYQYYKLHHDTTQNQQV
jgi:hypothetical protein